MLISRRCVAAGCDYVSLKECKHAEMKLSEERNYIGACWCHQASTWVTSPSSDDELECLNDKFSVVLKLFYKNPPDGVRFREAIAIKTWVNALSLSDTVPGGVISAFATTYVQASNSQSTKYINGPLLGAQVINMAANKVQVIAMVAINMKAISALNIQYNYELLLLGCC